EVSSGRAVEGQTENAQWRRRNRSRRRVIGEPGNADEQPVEKELRRQCRDGEVIALDAQGREAEHDTCSSRAEAAEGEDKEKVQPGQMDGDIVGSVGTHCHECRTL